MESKYDRKGSKEADRVRQRFPNRIPVICMKKPYSRLPTIKTKKFLVPTNMLVGEFKYIIFRHIMAERNGDYAEQSIYLFVKNSTPVNTDTLEEVYTRCKSEDGFLYMTYAAENTLGGEGETERQRDGGTERQRDG